MPDAILRFVWSHPTYKGVYATHLTEKYNLQESMTSPMFTNVKKWRNIKFTPRPETHIGGESKLDKCKRDVDYIDKCPEENRGDECIEHTIEVLVSRGYTRNIDGSSIPGAIKLKGGSRVKIRYILNNYNCEEV